jgi:hypothetical protein
MCYVELRMNCQTQRVRNLKLRYELEIINIVTWLLTSLGKLIYLTNYLTANIVAYKSSCMTAFELFILVST